MFWTNSLKRMGLIIWLGAFFKRRHWAIPPAHLRAFGYLFGSIWGAEINPEWKKEYKNLFSGCFGQFLLK
jgi:hypothetical protein